MRTNRIVIASFVVAPLISAGFCLLMPWWIAAPLAAVLVVTVDVFAPRPGRHRGNR